MNLSIKNLFELLFPLLVCSLYLPPVFYTLFTSSLFVLAIVALSKGYKVNFRQILPWLFAGFLVIHFSSFLLSDDYGTIWRSLQNKLSFVLLPFILLVFQPLLTRSFFRKLIAAFFYSSILISVIFLLISSFNLYESYQQLASQNQLSELRPFRYFYASILTHNYIHRSYFGLLIGTALFSSPFIFPINRTKKVFFVLAIFLLLIMLFLLQSRMVLGAFVICTLFYAVLQIIKTKSRKWTIYLVVGLISVATISYFFKDSPYNRFKDVGINNTEISYDAEKFSGTELRLAIWANNFDLIKEYPLLGVGYGDLREKRLEMYQKNNFTYGAKNEYNSHNQILETQLAAGIPGSIFLFAMFGFITWISIKRKDTHLFIITAFFFLNMVTEALFERQIAISFFCTYILAMAMGEKVAFKKEEPA